MTAAIILTLILSHLIAYRLGRLEAEREKALLFYAVRKAARAYPRFTSDEVWGILREEGILPPLEHPNAMGAVFLNLSKAKEIRNTRRTRKSARPGSHRRAVIVWTIATPRRRA